MLQDTKTINLAFSCETTRGCVDHMLMQSLPSRNIPATSRPSPKVQIGIMESAKMKDADAKAETLSAAAASTTSVSER